MTYSYFCRIADLPHLLPIYRSSPSQTFFIIGVLKSSTIFSGKYLCWRPFLIKFIKKRLQHRCFLWIFRNFKNSIFLEHLRWLLLDLFLACGISRLEVLCKKCVLRNFAKFTGKHKKEKKETLARWFSCKCCKIKNSFFLQTTSSGCFCTCHTPFSTHSLTSPRDL